jgi:hypothetical protein
MRVYGQHTECLILLVWPGYLFIDTKAVVLKLMHEQAAAPCSTLDFGIGKCNVTITKVGTSMEGTSLCM